MNKRRRYTAKSQKPNRRWHIPPPLIHGSDTLEGGSILQEWGNELGVTLWQAFRDVMLWATTEPEERDGLFVRASTRSAAPISDGFADPRLTTGVAVITELTADPGAARADVVSRACRELSEWAQEQGKPHTALAFAQDAALAARGSAGAAFWVATLAGRMNDHPRAEGWFRRAVGLARQSRDWRLYAQAFSGLGNLYIRRGNLPAARRLHTRALRGARRGGMRREQASALHDLFVVAVELGNASEAERLARQALERCGTRDERVHALAHDVAYFWMEQGNFGRALSVFQAVLPLIDKPVERVFVLANIVRAAGGVGDADGARSAARNVEQLLDDPVLKPATARALIEVGRGFFSLEDYAAAEGAARRAMISATEARENKVRFTAEALLSSIHDRTELVRVAPEPVEATAFSTGDELATDFIRTLEAIAGAA